MFYLYKRYMLLKAIIKYLKDPRQVDSVLQLGDLLSTASNQVQLELSNDFKEMINNQYGQADYDLRKLSNCPKNSLGQEFYLYLTQNNLNPNYYKLNKSKRGVTGKDYIKHRLRKTHDLWHLLTQFNTSEEGEAGLIAFYYAQIKSPLSALIICLSFVHFIRKRRSELPLLLNSVTRGWQLGQRAKPLIEVKWEELWDKNLEQLRSELRIIELK